MRLGVCLFDELEQLICPSGEPRSTNEFVKTDMGTPKVESSARRGLRLFSLLFAVILVVGLSIDLVRTSEAWSWEARKVRITRSEIVHDPDANGRPGSWAHDFLRIDFRDLGDGKNVQHVRLGFGPQSPPTGPFSYFGGSTPESYPIGKEIVAYRNPANHDQFILEQRNVSWVQIALLASAMGWIGWNIFGAVKNRLGKTAPDGILSELTTDN